MKYKFFGNKTEWVGKTLWEIVGNLKNFGVGRMVLQSTLLKYPEPSFWRIVRVQPIPPPENQFEDRNVLVWVEEVYKGRKVPEILKKSENKKPDFILVPKNEEHKYLKLAEDYVGKDTRKIIQKYINWPPLFKELWEAEYYRNHKEYKELPRLETQLKDDILSDIRLGEEDENIPQLTTDLYKQNVPVEELIKEIVRLQKIVNANS